MKAGKDLSLLRPSWPGLPRSRLPDRDPPAGL